MGLFKRVFGSGENKEEAFCDPNQIILVAEDWFRSSWGSSRTDCSSTMNRLLQRAKDVVQGDPHRKVAVWGCRMGPDNDDGRPMRFERYDIFYALWKHVGKPDSMSVGASGLGGFKHYCHKEEAFQNLTIPHPEQLSR